MEVSPVRAVPSARRLLPLAVLAILAVPAPAPAQAGCAHARDQVSASSMREARQAVRCLLNKTRARHGLRRLRFQADLQAAARHHSRDMTQRRFFAHDAPGGSTLVTRARRAGYVRPDMGWSVGENIGWGSGTLSTPHAMMRAWMNSPGHRANILTATYRHVGIGIALGSPRGGDGATYTTDFGARR